MRAVKILFLQTILCSLNKESFFHCFSYQSVNSTNTENRMYPVFWGFVGFFCFIKENVIFGM